MKDFMISALKVSGTVLLGYFDKPLETKQKESQSSIVTEADLASEKVITELIKEKYPGHNILSEECGYLDGKSEFTWVIDPLDGTSNFASGIPWFGVLIALFRNNRPVMGGAYLPVQGDIYFAEAGKGAYKNNKPLPELKNRSLRESLIAFCLDYSEDEVFLDKGLKAFKYIIKNSRNIRSTNSLVDFLYVAEGRFGGVINLFTKVWDISALGLIISEAGGIMTDVSGSRITFNMGSEIIEENFPVIAGNKTVAESIRI
jgi:myo-inositol-1(or 4)-monophosphatase